MNELRWYVLKVVSGQEKRIKSQLEEELKKMMREGILSMPEKIVYSELNQPLRSSYSLLRRTHSVAFEKYF